MKNRIIERTICAILATLILTSFTACHGPTAEVPKTETEPEYKEDIKLEVIVEPITYSDEFIENANVRFTNIACSLVESHMNVTLDNKQRQSINSEFKKTVVPIAYRVRIYEDELDAILTSFEDYVDNGGDALSILDLYDRCLYEIGSERSGKLTYELSLKIIDRKEKDAREKYAEYDYDWYLEDAERCAELLISLREMGDQKFVSIISVISFLASLTRNEIQDGESAFQLNGKDLIYIMEHQGELFEKNEFCEDDFSIFGALMQEMIPKKGDTLSAEMLYTLKNNEYFPTALRCMPKVISLYAAVTKALNNDDTLVADADADQVARAIAKAMLASEGAMDELDVALNSYAKSESRGEKEVIDSFAGDDVEEIIPLNLMGLMDELSLISGDGSASAYDRLQDSLISYLYSIAPYITMAFFI